MDPKSPSEVCKSTVACVAPAWMVGQRDCCCRWASTRGAVSTPLRPWHVLTGHPPTRSLWQPADRMPSCPPAAHLCAPLRRAAPRCTCAPAMQGRAKPPVPTALANKSRDDLLAMLLDALKKLKQRDKRIEGAHAMGRAPRGTATDPCGRRRGRAPAHA